jgi:hypothetical protein
MHCNPAGIRRRISFMRHIRDAARQPDVKANLAE